MMRIAPVMTPVNSKIRFGAGKAQEVGSSDFDAEVLKSPIPVMVDFYATWCPPCRALSPTVDELAAKYQGKVKVVKVNVDNSPELVANYNISGIPALLFFNQHQVVNRLVGIQSKAKLTKLLDQLAP